MGKSDFAASYQPGNGRLSERESFRNATNDIAIGKFYVYIGKIMAHPCENRGRKASGLPSSDHDSGAAKLDRTYAKPPQRRCAALPYNSYCLRRRALLEQFCVSSIELSQLDIRCVLRRDPSLVVLVHCVHCLGGKHDELFCCTCSVAYCSDNECVESALPPHCRTT